MNSSKLRNLILIAIAELLGMSVWFSASAVIPQLTIEWGISEVQKSWLTMSVQIGFVVGALISATLNLSDKIKSYRLFFYSGILGGLFNLLIPVFNSGIEVTIVLRFLTGVTLAGIYPPAMKFITTWCKEDRGLWIGILVGSTTMGSALPHLINAFPIFGEMGMPPWQDVLYFTSINSFVAAVLVLITLKEGPFSTKAPPFNLKFAIDALKYKPVRLANFGYLGHMWELYAMWAWVPILIIESFEQNGYSVFAARVIGFSSLAIGAAGSIIAGKLADKFGRTKLTSLSLLISGACCLIVGFFFNSPILLSIVCLIWGFAVVADSAQFSAAVSELADQRYVGSALTIQTSLGFLLTLITLQLIPVLKELYGWQFIFSILVIGPVFGISSMLSLRNLPEAEKMASGNR